MKSNICDYNHAYIFVRGNITVIGYQVTQAESGNCAPFTKCIIKLMEQKDMMLKI